jgi:predicted neuraminidase
MQMFTEVTNERVFGSVKPFKCCHASHLAVLGDGSVLAVWFAGSREGADDVSIWFSRRVQSSWSEPVRLEDAVQLPHWNPVLFTKEDGQLLLFYKVGRLLKEWYTLLRQSDDGGVTWSSPVELVEGDRGGRGTVRNKLIVLSDGTWLAPSSSEDGIWSASVDRSADLGQSWSMSEKICIPELDYANLDKVESGIPVSEQSFYGKGVIQPTLWESAPGHVHMLLRSTECRIYRSDSSDYGLTWSDAYPTELPNNNSGIDVVKMDSGMLVLVYNPVGVNWGPRSPLVLRTSSDNGATWANEWALESEEGEFSYPAILARGQDLFITYTWKRESIAFRQLRWSDK